MSPTNKQILKTLVLVVILGYLLAPESCEARGLNGDAGGLSQDDIISYQQSIQQAQQQLANSGQLQQPSLDRLDSDGDDDDDDDRVQLQPAAVQPAGSDIYQTGQQAAASYQPPLGVEDLRVAASKHHGHKHGAKGWLDMGAWTGKKGAFGWYDKHPVGKGK